MSITFLNSANSCHWIKKYHASYIQNITQNDLNRKLRNYDSVQTFCKYIKPWKPEWKLWIKEAVSFIIKKCWSWRKMLNNQWIFIAVDNKIDGGMPHTIHNAIVLPLWFIESFQDTNIREDTSLLETLIHEKIHNLQKLYPQRFAGLYQKWGWQLAPPEKIPNSVLNVHRMNPDTPTNWMLISPKSPNIYWIPCVRLKTDSKDLTDADLMLVKCNSTLKTIEWHSMTDTKWYASFYGTNLNQHRKYCYHPDETSAVILAQYMIGISVEKKPKGDLILLNWVHQWDSYS